MAAALGEEVPDNEDYYALLNVRREASQEELKASYRRLCMLYHPDKHRDPELKTQAERLFNLVHQAYEEEQCSINSAMIKMWSFFFISCMLEIIFSPLPLLLKRLP